MPRSAREHAEIRMSSGVSFAGGQDVRLIRARPAT
jgi:hypothetical protein